MGNRRKSREFAVQALFFMDMNQNFSEEYLSLFSDHFVSSSSVRPFFIELVRGVLRARSGIDSLVERFSNNWKVSRMSAVDRNIMRLAVYEMIVCKDIPFIVSINEAVDLGKKYGTEESGSFVNGILDSIRTAMATESLTIPVDDPPENLSDPSVSGTSGQHPDSDMKEDDMPALSFSVETDPSGQPENPDEPVPRQPRRTLIR